MALVEVTQAQHRGQLQVAPGDVVEVRLAENATNAYRWAFSLSGPVVQMSDGFGPATTPQADGGERCMRLMARSPGTAHLGAVLRRAWETAGQPSEVFELTLKVTEPAGPRHAAAG